MKKIVFKINDEDFWLFIDKQLLKKLTQFVGQKEKAGYLFIDKIKNTNEFRCRNFTMPHKKDISTNQYIEMSRKHQRIARKIQRNNPYLYEAGFYHTHPEWFGCEPSKYDLQIFKQKSEKYFISLFLIVISNTIKCLIYSFGEKIKEELWKI